MKPKSHRYFLPSS